MEKLDLVFGIPERGWMKIDFLSKSKIVSSQEVSDVPCDSLYNLVKALVHLTEGSNEEVVEWSLEPEYAEWTFKRKGDQLEFFAMNPGSGRPVFAYRDQASRLIHGFYKLLKDLEANPAWQAPDATERIWSWPFPSTLLSDLKKKIGSASDPGK